MQVQILGKSRSFPWENLPSLAGAIWSVKTAGSITEVEPSDFALFCNCASDTLSDDVT